VENSKEKKKIENNKNVITDGKKDNYMLSKALRDNLIRRKKTKSKTKT